MFVFPLSPTVQSFCLIRCGSPIIVRQSIFEMRFVCFPQAGLDQFVNCNEHDQSIATVEHYFVQITKIYSLDSVRKTTWCFLKFQITCLADHVYVL